MIHSENLGDVIKELLAGKGMSSAELARASGVSMASLSRILSGHTNPGFGSVVKIARALGVPLDSLVAPQADNVPVVGGGASAVLSPETALTAVLELADTDHTPASASKLISSAMQGVWVDSWTQEYADPTQPQPAVTHAETVGPRRIRLHLLVPHLLIEGGSVPGVLSVVSAALTGTGARLMDIRLPELLARTFRGPAFGVRGLRDAMNKHGRPLMSCTIRPMQGLSARQYGRAVYEALVGGADFCADPVLLHSIPTNGWRERFRYAAEAAHAAMRETNEFKSHACNITAPTVDLMLERALWAKDMEMAMVMVDSVAIGWAALHSLTEWCRKNEMVLCAMGGRALSGDMMSEQLHAKLLRWAGCDMVSTASPLRGSVTNRRQVSGVMAALRDDLVQAAPDTGHYVSQPFHGLNPAIPAVGGGHNPWHFPRLIDAMGDHVVIQCGGSIMGHPWGSQAGAIANRTAIEALVQARNEGVSLAVEGRTILSKAARYCPELKAALDHWHEGAFLFGVIGGTGTNPGVGKATGGEVQTFPAPKPDNIKPFAPRKDDDEPEDDA
ncbi:MAG TPA: RuBisCO large subunit C-terminal-like domain-containing protein [Alphaproteobacteria bacterium]|nr:RuBisCO large subunit C-terminal-like domain-containing protein [Alphaproteobacteria bacterium]